MTQKYLFRMGDVLPMAVCLVLIVASAVFAVTAHTGECVQVQTPGGVYILPLADDSEQVFVGKDGLSVTVAVADGCVSVLRADCDDRICVHTGKLGGAVRAIACVPAGIVVTLIDNGDAPDAVAR